MIHCRIERRRWLRSLLVIITNVVVCLQTGAGRCDPNIRTTFIILSSVAVQG